MRNKAFAILSLQLKFQKVFIKLKYQVKIYLIVKCTISLNITRREFNLITSIHCVIAKIW